MVTCRSGRVAEYVRDAVGRIKQVKVTFNGATVTYDGMGNLVGNGGVGSILSYGYSGRLAQIYTGNVGTGQSSLHLLYNGLGELARTRATAQDVCGNTNETYRDYYHFAPDGRALGLVQQVASRVQWDWVWIDNLPVLQFQDSYDASGTLIGRKTTYLHPDHLGTPRIGTDANGATSWRFRSDGFGKATLSGAHNVRLRFPGQIDLAFRGINYNYFRSYDPNTGRYLESDPIGLNGGNNTYAYANGNPLSFIDPTGLFSPLVGAGAGAVVGGVVGAIGGAINTGTIAGTLPHFRVFGSNDAGVMVRRS